MALKPTLSLLKEGRGPWTQPKGPGVFASEVALKH